MKEREINDNPQDKFNPDEVRIEKLNSIVEIHYEAHKRGAIYDIGWTLEVCLGNINCENEKYTPKEISEALLQHFAYDDIIRFLLTDYLENL